MKIINDLELIEVKPAHCNVCGYWEKIGIFSYKGGHHYFISDLWICAKCLNKMAEHITKKEG